MFERFTDRARRVVVLGQEEARLLRHDYIGTEHLLLGLVHDDSGVAGKVLGKLGVGLDTARSAVREIKPDGDHAPAGHIPFTPHAKETLQLSLREALQRGHNYIGTEHLLLGMLRLGDCSGATILTRLGMEIPRVRQAVIEALAGDPSDEPVSGTSALSGASRLASLLSAVSWRERSHAHSDSPYEERYGFSRAVRVGNRIEVAGTAPIPPKDVELPESAHEQMLLCGTIAIAALAELGGSAADVVRTVMYITDPSYADEVGRAHGELFGEAAPAATMVVVAALLQPEWKVEIEVTAVV